MTEKRIGTLTCGVSLVAFGIIFIIMNFAPNAIDLLSILRFWPVILILLGIEVLIASFSKKACAKKYDFGSFIIMLLMLGAAFSMEAVYYGLSTSL